MGSLFKQIYRYTRPRAYRHNENLWPWVKIRRAESGEICALQYKGESVPLCSLSELKDAFSGPMLLTATGPSINDVDFRLSVIVAGNGRQRRLLSRRKGRVFSVSDR